MCRAPHSADDAPQHISHSANWRAFSRLTRLSNNASTDTLFYLDSTVLETIKNTRRNDDFYQSDTIILTICQPSKNNTIQPKLQRGRTSATDPRSHGNNQETFLTDFQKNLLPQLRSYSRQCKKSIQLPIVFKNK